MSQVPRELVDGLADRYAVEREVGAGGMATVYLARDLRHRRPVAIKVLRPELAASLGSERFLREVEVAAALTHPHIVPLHDSGEAGGHLYYVMPFIEGESLRERLARDGALPVPEAGRILRQVVDALDEAHTRGVVHRDVKPANVLLTRGHALVSDFGVARAVSEATSAHRMTSMGVALGTPQYMAPEQASADPSADHRADLFAVGVLAYEMLTGVSPFAASTTPAVFAALMTRTPEPPHTLRPAVPESLSGVVMACLEKDPDARPQSARELLGRLDAVLTPASGVVPPAPTSTTARPRARRAAAVAAAVAVVVVGTVAGWRLTERGARVAWARGEAIPEVIRLIGENRMREAAELAEEAEAVVGADPVLAPLWEVMSTPFRITSQPSGAAISFRPYDSAPDAWRRLGVTPFEGDRFPVGAYRFRLELSGYEPVEQARSFISGRQLSELGHAAFDYMTDPSYVVDARLVPEGDGASTMVVVPGGPYGLLPITGFGVLSPIDIPEYRIDRTEVTNAAYEAFVREGGYRESVHWVEPRVRDGRTLEWSEVVATFVDATGRPGPSTWVLGRPPQGQEEHPVGGVSWFEAAAYCRWRGASLPTLYHWARAALPSSDVWLPFNHLLAAASNLEGSGPVPAGSLDAIGVSGARDLAGNVREWTMTASGSDRHLAGGAWSDPAYALHDQTIASPWVRFPTDGFRCALFPDGAPPLHLAGSLDLPTQDLERVATMPDAVFESMTRTHVYDHSQPLVATVDSTYTLDWGARVEWVSVSTPYGDRLPIRIHIPEHPEPPYQPVVFIPGGNLLRSRQIEALLPDFVVRAGRVVVEPIVDGAFHRNDGTTLQRFSTPSSRAEIESHWIQELGRTIDYLERRDDMDGTRVSYLGLSLGAGVVPILLPFEPRFRAAVLYSGGFSRQADQAALDHGIALAGRITRPILMLGGRHDFANPTTHQEALFRAFGTPDADKHLRVFEGGGHWPLPLNDVIRETVDFLDRYLGPVPSS